MTKKLKSILIIVIPVLIISTIVYAGSLDPPGAPGSTMKTLQEVYDSIAGTFNSSSITADQNGSLIENLKYITNNLFWASSSDDIYTTNSGNVGIGTSTPAEHLEISGAGDQYIQVNSTDGATPGIKLIDSGAGNYDWRARVAEDRLYFGYSIDDGSSWYSSLYFSGLQSSPKIRTWSSNADLNIGAGDDLIFQTYGSSWDEKLRILENGNVGVGTSTPEKNIEIAAIDEPTLQITSTGGTMQPSLIFKRMGSSYTDWEIHNRSGYLYFARSTDDGATWSETMRVSGTRSEPNIRTGSTSAVLHISSGNDIIFDTYGTGWDERVRITESGNVGIGNTNPGYLLTMEASGGGYYSTTTNAWIDGSSGRYKENIKPITNALDIVQQLEGVYFNWNKEHGGAPSLGFIAEQVGAVLPQIVDWDKDNPEYAAGLDYGKITAVLLEAIKEQQKEIESLKSAIKALQEHCEK